MSQVCYNTSIILNDQDQFFTYKMKFSKQRTCIIHGSVKLYSLASKYCKPLHIKIHIFRHHNYCSQKANSLYLYARGAESETKTLNIKHINIIIQKCSILISCNIHFKILSLFFFNSKLMLAD